MSRFPGQVMQNMKNNSVERRPAGQAGIACSVEGQEEKNCHCLAGRQALNAKHGFTLIEVLIVTLILSIISLAIFSTFSNGLKIYNRINSEVTLEDLVIFLDRLGQDLRNSLNFSTINFTGKAEELEFAGITNSHRMQKRTVGKIKYVFDSSAEELSRFAGDYSLVYNQEWLSSRQTLEKIKSCIFSYYYYDNQTKEFSWLPEWNKAGLPVALRLELGLKDKPEDKFIRTFNIPVGNNVRNDTKKEEQGK